MTYGGDVTCEFAWKQLKADSNAQLVDVRTRAEWAFVGIPALEELSKSPLLIEWQVYPAMEINAGFVDELDRQLGAMGVDTDSPVFFLCRSGGRSLAAANALAARGYTKAFNVTGGFEGDLDSSGHRGNVSGWKHANLPWRQK